MGASDNKRTVVVGIFVFLAIAILVSAIFVLGGQQKRFTKTIRVTAVFDNVSGLKVGDNVWFSGVKIGTVKRIDLHGESKVRIAMNIEDQARQFIHKGAQARLGSESLIGSKLIEITGGSAQAPPVEDGDQLTVVQALSTEDLMATLQENNKNLVDITNDFKALSAGLVQGKGMAGALLTDTTLSADFRTILASLQQASRNSVRVSRDLARLSDKFNTEGGLANELLTDTAVFANLRQSVEQLQRTSASAAEMTANLNETSTKLNDDKNAVGVLLNDQQFATQLKSTMENLETSTDKLDENMEALQHNFLFRGYFKRRPSGTGKPGRPPSTPWIPRSPTRPGPTQPCWHQSPRRKSNATNFAALPGSLTKRESLPEPGGFFLWPAPGIPSIHRVPSGVVSETDGGVGH
jgi:phospholipid/cholesterol/gamma-HCH transport system substrate-binding protein